MFKIYKYFKREYCLFLTLSLIFIFQTTYSQNVRDEVLATFKGEPIGIESALSIYIKFNSISGNEKAAGEWLKEFCIENGLYVKQMGDENNNYNLAASLYPLSQQLPNIIFLNHIDVVPAGDISEWENEPFSGKIVDGEIWGRGSFDNKGNALMQLFALLEIKKSNTKYQLPYNITFLAVSSEETQNDGGVKFVIDNYLTELNPEVVIGEGPPGLVGLIDSNSEIPLFCISVAHKRALWLALELSIETSGHGSVTPSQYANKEMNTALYKLLKKQPKAIYTDLNVDILKQLGKVQGGFKGGVLKHPKLFKPLIIKQLRNKPEIFALFSNTVTLTNIESYSEAINVIPNKITAHLDCRLLPNESSEIFLEDLTKKLDNNNIKIKVIASMPNVESSESDSRYYKSIHESIKQTYPDSNIITTMLPNFNDVGAFRKEGIQGYAITPVILEKKYLESIHNTNERIPVSILVKGQQTYVYFINDLVKH